MADLPLRGVVSRLKEGPPLISSLVRYSTDEIAWASAEESTNDTAVVRLCENVGESLRECFCVLVG